MAKSPRKNTAKLTALLTGVLSDTYVLLVKAHAYHWNIVGPQFPQLHNYFGTQYEELLEAADELAERIRILGAPAPCGMADFLKNTVIKETKAPGSDAQAALKDYLKAHELLRDRLAAVCEAADEVDDEVTEGMIVERMQAHDKAIWMLRSTIG